MNSAALIILLVDKYLIFKECVNRKKGELMNEIFAQRFKSARLKAGLSFQALADILNGSITKQALNKYEKGKALPNSKNLMAIANALNSKMEYFFRPARVEVHLSRPAYRKRTNLSAKKLGAIQENSRFLGKNRWLTS